MKNVTALVKSFLRDPYLFRAVKSLKDSHPDIHVLVADDGRVSDTKEAKLRDMGVERYICLPYASCGITKGRNLMVDACETEYCLIGDDDFLYTQDSHLEFLLKLMEVADIAGGAIIEGGILGHFEGFYRWTPQGAIFFENIDRTYGSSHSGIRYSPADYIFNFFIAKTEALRRVRWDEQFHATWEHEDFFLSAHKAGLKTVYCPDSVVIHRGLMADPLEYDQIRHRGDSRAEQAMMKKWGFREQQLIHEYAGRIHSDTTSLMTEPVEPAAAIPEKTEYQVVTIHYATDRAASGNKTRPKFGAKRALKDKTMSYGTCDVSIPRDHKKGEMERPRLWRKEDPRKHIVLLEVRAMDPAAFFASAKKGKQAFVFVHGFNVTFTEAARRTAQIANDLPFDGLPVLYSWPSQGSLTRTAYQTDETNVEWTIPHLEQFLKDLVEESGITTLHLIGHSMGNRALVRALKEIALKAPGQAAFHEVVLSAPDIDADTFEDLAKEFLKAARRVTLYASAEDVALQFSKKLHGNKRAGDAAGGVVVVDGMDSVDATGVDTSFLGHSYVGSEKSVLTDLYYALKGDIASERKATIKVAPAGTYYQFIL